MRPGKYGISLNQRSDGTIIDNIFEALFVPGVRPSAWMIREVLDADSTPGRGFVGIFPRVADYFNFNLKI
jgi:hypothetical protein